MIVPSGKPIAFEYSIYSGDAVRPVSMKIYDISTGTAVLVTTVTMTHVFNGTYWGAYTFPDASVGKNYLIQKSVYTDGTFTAADGSYSPGSEMVEIDGFAGSSGSAI
jgi:hypothetical protein